MNCVVILYIHKWITNQVHMNKSLEENCICKYVHSIFPFPQWKKHLLQPMSVANSLHYVQETFSLPRTSGPGHFHNWWVVWAVWVFLAGVFTEEEDVDFHWSLVELSHMCRHCLGKDDILVLGLADLKNGDFRGMLDSVPHFIGTIWRLVFLTHHHVHTPVIHLKCILFVNETNHIFAASNV